MDTAIANERGLPVTPEPIRTWKYGCDMPLPHSKTSIPYMAFTMQMLLAGMALGISGKVFPEVVCLCACNTAPLWVVLEMLVLLLHLYPPLHTLNEYLGRAGP